MTSASPYPREPDNMLGLRVQVSESIPRDCVVFASPGKYMPVIRGIDVAIVEVERPRILGVIRGVLP